MKRSRFEQSQGAFIKEYEINASVRLLFPYISTSAGLGQWFADKALTLTDTTFNFIWDRQEHLATMVSQKLNKLVRFEFPEPIEIGEIADPELHPFIEFSLEKSPVSQSVFLKVVDKTASTTEDPEEVWDSLVMNLKDLVGG